jgi:membrane protein
MTRFLQFVRRFFARRLGEDNQWQKGCSNLSVMSLRGSLAVAKRVFSDWNKHDDPRLGAALAFYTVLSLSPLLVLTVAIAAFFFDRSMVMRQLTDQIKGLIGAEGAQTVQATLDNAQKSQSGGAASIVSLLVLVFGASGVCGELRSALNRIWEVGDAPDAGIWAMVRDRLFSFGMVLAVGFLLLAALILSTVLAVVSTLVGNIVPFPHVLAAGVDLVISFFGIGAVFALIYRYVPSARIGWRQAWIGGLMTSVLFAIGKYLIGFYLAKAAPGSAYGTAGSVIVIIVWVYYTAQIVFFGAEFTHVYPEMGTLSERRERRQSSEIPPAAGNRVSAH